jgi:acyl-homoserine lactone acylase PvdQ
MHKLFLISFLLPAACSLSNKDADIKRYEEQASRVTIIRDKWGVPHVYGKTDADAVFGLMYAQCEENFEKVEGNYLEKLGRLSETGGEGHLQNDLLMRLLYDSSAAIADYKKSPRWLKTLLHAFADGINYYLYKHPRTKPAGLKKFEPWFPLMFTDGGYTAMQTGGLEMEDIRNLYFPSEGPKPSTSYERPVFKNHSTGSNAFAIAPARTASKKAMLYINPHVSFYFRTEMHMVSEEGLNAYGAVTWGQFFVFQGFNQHCGWMHTSSMADAADLYREKIHRKDDSIWYEYNGQLKPVTEKKLLLHYNNGENVAQKDITGYYTHHGPVVGARNGDWLSLKEQNRSLNGLIQSWQRTKAKDYSEFKKTMQLLANSSTNTLYADNKGNIAYWHGNFIPGRDPQFDWTLPVDGNVSATEWKSIHKLDEIVQVYNPKQGWIQNCNSSPFNASGNNSLLPETYPTYMAPEGENFRSLFAISELEKETLFTPDKLVALGYNHYLSLFDSLLPPLFRAYDSLAASEPQQSLLKEPVAILKAWDKSSSVSSVATTIAIEWAYYLINDNYYEMTNERASDQIRLFTSFAKKTSSKKMLQMLLTIIEGLEKMYGTWKVPWGDINRYQRNKDGQKFDDAKPSLPVGMVSALFGSLPAYETEWDANRKGYGIAGNSFVAVVEFGETLKAKSVITGGQSFDPGSKHFTDQAAMYINGNFKDVLFYKKDVKKHAEREYHPGE